MCVKNSVTYAVIAGGLAALLAIAPTAAQRRNATADGDAAGSYALAGGQNGFDFEFGRWNSHVKRLQRPLSGSTDWVEYQGTTVVGKLLGGRANAAELDVTGPSGHIEGVALRLYNPQTQQWSIHYANLRDGALTAPIVGRFEHGRGEFYGDDQLGDRPIRVRFVIRCETRDRCLFEQAYSADAGKTWEMNWVGTDTRVRDGDK